MNKILSKALLGLCIAAPAMAKLPVVSGKVGALQLSTSTGFTAQQKTAIKNGFGVWLLNMNHYLGYPGNTRFRLTNSMDNENFAAKVSIQLSSDVSPVACASTEALDVCGVLISGDDGISTNPVVTVYKKAVRAGTTLDLPLGDATAFQNIMIRTAGRLLGAPWTNLSQSSQYMSTNRENSWKSFLFLPAQVDLNSLQTFYNPNPGGNNTNIAPMVEFAQVNAAGAITGFKRYTSFVGLQLNAAGLKLFSARWILNLATPSVYGNNIPFELNHILTSGKINVVGEESCYPAASSNLLVQFVGGTESSFLALSQLTDFGAPTSEMFRYANPTYDLIGLYGPLGCNTSMGYAVDLYSGL